MKFDHKQIEKKWQERWYASPELKSGPTGEKKFYLHFAYPGVSGHQHVGHMRGFTYSDMICRLKRMQGHSIFFPVGTHASGNVAPTWLRKLKEGREDIINNLKIDGLNEKQIEQLKKDGEKDIMVVLKYFTENYQKTFKRFGLLADFDAIVCTQYPQYQKFIEWQFRKLKNLGMLKQIESYEAYCPKDGSVAVDPSETDLSKGGNAQQNEYTLLKFEFEKPNRYIIAATLRPETVYGQTNLWIDPNVEYALAKVDGEEWILSQEALSKLRYQKDNLEVIQKIKGGNLIGQYAKAPGVDREIIILPSKFCDPGIGSGIVTSVPSDAPIDYMGLVDLQKSKVDCEKYGLDYEKIKSIEVIPIMEVKGYGDMAAVKICRDLKIKNQDDPKLEEAKKEVYKAGFHTGTMTKHSGKYAGMSVMEAKDKIKQELISAGKADVFVDFSEPVVCRCGERVVVKKINDQWVIDYKNPEVKEKSKEHAKRMNIYPQSYKDNLPGVLDWFGYRSATRRGNWVGTPFPFDKGWTIEAISDSTLYPAFYVVSRYFNAGKLQLDDLTEEFFDYVFLGKGKPKNETWKQVKKEFEYWYPVDINLGGKEHQTVHFPVYIMNHAAILPENDWPQGIFVNYWVTEGGGEKISKSKGGVFSNAIPPADEYSVDGMRLFYAHVGSPFSDIEWAHDTVMNYKSQAERFYNAVMEMKQVKGSKKKHIDAWLESRINTIIKSTTISFNSLELRKAIDQAMFAGLKVLAWYKTRNGDNKEVAKWAAETLVKLINPVIPHTCEELWEQLGNKGFVVQQPYPVADETKIDGTAEANEQMLLGLQGDIENVQKLANLGKLANITIFIAPEWKRTVYRMAAQMKHPQNILKNAMQQEDVKAHGKQAVTYVSYLSKHAGELLDDVPSEQQEFDAIKEASDFFKQRFGAEVEVMKASGSKEAKAGNAVPLKPAILIS